MNNLRPIFALLFLLFTFSAHAEDRWTEWGPTSRESNAGVIARVGYTIGGTTPIPLPAEIRRMNGFKPKGGVTFGADAYKMVSRRWGFSAGWHFFYEGFHTSANVKNYRMSLTMEGNTMGGYFTGCDVTNTDMWGVTIPILATLRLSPRWNLSFGPYVSFYFWQNFSGEVYDNTDGIGYLRVDTPTGEKVNMSRNNPATYDFSENMRPWNAGLEVCFDLKVMKHLNAFGSLDWGLSNIMDPDFDAAAFTMYPIYATSGVAYRY